MTRETTPYRMLSLCLGVLLCCVPWRGVESSCPWEDQNLHLWSSPLTWDSGQVPKDGEEVSITKRVLLDTQPGTLATVTIQPGAALIWGNVPDLVLRATYILVLGEFHIGHDACRFQHKATIKLYGRPDSIHEVAGLGRKFLGVAPGGVLELHGQDKMSWSKLSQRIQAMSDNIPCAYVYDHKTTSLARETKPGMNVVIWEPNGRLFDFDVFSTDNWSTLPQFLSVPDGYVVAASVNTDLGTPTQTFYVAMESLGAKSIRVVKPNQQYAFIARKGVITSVAEKLANVSELDTGYIHLPDYMRNLDFGVTSAKNEVDFRVLNGDFAFPIISVAHDVSSWQTGDEVLVTSTDFDWRQLEVRRIVECTTCKANQIRLDAPFQNMHYGEVTLNVDERAEVALLTRNILIEGEVQDTCENYGDQTLCDLFGMDTFGGQVKALRGSTVHIQGVELNHMGQQDTLASYPLHFHMMDDASGMWFRNNSIHHSFSRCVTIHGTDHAEVSDNVCYHHLGHGFYLEDSVEQNNVLDRNLGVGTLHGTLLMSDKKSEWCAADGLEDYCDSLSTFWLTHPNNVVANNVAAGSDKNGYFFVFSDRPLGLSAARQAELGKVLPYSLQYIPIKRFYNNVAHSNVKSGLFFDHEISASEMHEGKLIPPNGIIPHAPAYDPRDPPNENGVRVWTTLERLTFYKNIRQNVWIKAGNIQVTDSSFGDSVMGYGGGNTGSNTGNKVKNSVFVGQTDNKGMPQRWTDWSLAGQPSYQFDHSVAGSPYDSITGVQFDQGPMFVENCHFARYRHDWWANGWIEQYGVRGVTPGGAISWHRPALYPTTPFSTVRGLKFGFCDDVDGANWAFMGNSSLFQWPDTDPAQMPTVKDADGSLTGQAGTQLVLNRPFYTGPECRYHANWAMAACPYRYVQVEVWGDNGVLDTSRRKKFPLIVRRDDVPDDPFIIAGTKRNIYILRTHKSYTICFNKTLGPVPSYVMISAYGLEAGDVVRIALCLPKSTTQFKISNEYPVITSTDGPVWAASLAQLDSDTVGNMLFWDNTNGLLYFKLITDRVRQNESEDCAGGLCYTLEIFRLDGDNEPVDCSGFPTPPYVDNSQPTPTVPVPKPCPAVPQSAEGLGAVNPAEIVTSDPVLISCRTFGPETGRLTPARKGCYKDKAWVEPDMPEFLQILPNSMTQKFCIDRCYKRGYKYAGLQVGKMCACSNTYGRYGGAAEPCNEPCKGDPAKTCGGATKKALEVFATGRP